MYGSFDFLQEETGKIETTQMLEPIVPGAEFAEALKFDFIDGCTPMIRMSALRRVGGFNAQYRHSQDMELWMRLASHGYRFHLIPHKLTIRPGSAAPASMSWLTWRNKVRQRTQGHQARHQCHRPVLAIETLHPNELLSVPKRMRTQ